MKKIPTSEIKGNPSTIIAPSGTVVVDPVGKTIAIHDGVTAGGTSIGGGGLTPAQLSGVPVAVSTRDFADSDNLLTLRATSSCSLTMRAGRVAGFQVNIQISSGTVLQIVSDGVCLLNDSTATITRIGSVSQRSIFIAYEAPNQYGVTGI